MIYIVLFLFSSLIFSEDFQLQDINDSSDYFGEVVGPSSFSNTVSLVYFGHFN